jgi:hypothetical protein
VTLRDAVPRTCKWLVTHVVASLKAEGEPRRGLTGVHIALTLSFSAQGESCCWVIDYRLSGCLIGALVTLRDAVPRTCKWLVTHVVASLMAEGELEPIFIL